MPRALAYGGSSVATIKKPHLRQLNVKSYEINQIQSYASQALNETVRYIDLQETKKAVIGISATYTFNCVAGHRNDYLTFQTPLYDPFQTYNPITGVFTAPLKAIYYVSVNFLLSSSAAGDFRLLGQLNQSDIQPQATIGTNFFFSFSYGILAATGDIQMSGAAYVPMLKDDQFKLYLYSSVDNPTIASPANPTPTQPASRNAQVSYTW